MTTLKFICVLCSAGLLVGLSGLLFLCLAAKVLEGGKPTAGVKVVIAIVAILTCAGFVGCAVEDRVCDMCTRGQP